MKKSIIISYIIILVVSIILIFTTNMYIQNEIEKIDGIQYEKFNEFRKESDMLFPLSYSYNIVLYHNIIGIIGLVGLNIYTLKRKDNTINKRKLIFWLLMIPIAFISVFYVGNYSNTGMSVPVSLSFSFFNLIIYSIILIFSHFI